MGYRNPVTTAAAVNTASGPGAGGVSMYSQTTSGGGGAPLVAGVVDFDDGFPGDTHATITRTAQQNAHSDLPSAVSGALSIAGGSIGTSPLPNLDLEVLDPALSTTGTDAHLYVPGGTLTRFRVDGPVVEPAGTAAVMAPGNYPGAALPADAAPIIKSGTAVTTTDASGNVTIGFGVAFPGGCCTVVSWPGDTASGLAWLVTFATSSKTQFVAHTNLGAGATVRVNWLAIGF